MASILEAVPDLLAIPSSAAGGKFPLREDVAEYSVCDSRLLVYPHGSSKVTDHQDLLPTYSSPFKREFHGWRLVIVGLAVFSFQVSRCSSSIILPHRPAGVKPRLISKPPLSAISEKVLIR